ncbi:MAG: 23S rRNA (pseudouridine(1915)-N(3))-methyltransferase RlmH [Lachnospiraceae bacterium]|nr:23S rRNA (pseudouridine(1915)-N(3))-methyltransferase RlmH [Lachnospiraceae bacterium]
MKIDIICVGKLKEKYWKDAVAEYEKRLSRYCRLSILEVNDERTREDSSEAENERVLRLEGERIQKLISEDAYTVTLEILGEEMTSPELAKRTEELFTQGVSHIQFIIGGSLGLSKELTKRSRLHLSFSKLTFPHQLMRVILLEQIYRSFKINSGEPYHK